MLAKHPALLALLFAAAVTGCQRTPDEPQPRPSATPQMVEVPLSADAAPLVVASVASAPTAPRPAHPPECIAATPPEAPGPVPPVATTCPRDPEGRSMLPILPVRLDGAGTTISAEIVHAPHDLEKGLMYRTKMAEDAGMLFQLGERTVHRFWMHNTCIPLDLLYIDEDGTLVGIVENAPTLNDDERSVPCRSAYVLELNAGYCRRHGVRAGQHVTLPPG